MHLSYLRPFLPAKLQVLVSHGDERAVRVSELRMRVFRARAQAAERAVTLANDCTAIVVRAEKGLVTLR